jgi:hypothetical protein
VGCHKKMVFPFYQCTGGPERVIFCEVWLPWVGCRKGALKF